MAADDELAIPTEMRIYAATTVDQARKAFHDFVVAAERTIAALEAGSVAAKDEAAEARRRMLGSAEEHVAAAFDLAERMVKAGTVDEIVALQAAFIARTMTPGSRTNGGEETAR